MTGGLLVGPTLRALFHQVERSVRRLETRDRYDMASERPLTGRWRAVTVPVAEGAMAGRHRGQRIGPLDSSQGVEDCGPAADGGQNQAGLG